MNSIQFFANNLWRWKCGLPEIPYKEEVPNLERLKKTQWSEEFEQLMRNRLVMGAFRYGVFGKKGKPKYDSISSIIKIAKQYRKTGNTELLVDIANLALVEFIEGNHPLKHFKALDDAEHVTQR